MSHVHCAQLISKTICFIKTCLLTFLASSGVDSSRSPPPSPPPQILPRISVWWVKCPVLAAQQQQALLDPQT